MDDNTVKAILAYALLDRIWQHILTADSSLATDESRKEAREVIDAAQDEVAAEIPSFASHLKVRQFNSLTREL